MDEVKIDSDVIVLEDKEVIVHSFENLVVTMFVIFTNL
jgi:hypothetical protein